jgi:hypothetical protein
MIRIAEATVADIEILTFDELLDIYNDITLDEVRAVAGDIAGAQPTVAVVGPYIGQAFDQFE